MALTLTHWAESITYINHDGEELDYKVKEKLDSKKIQYMKEPIEAVLTSDDPSRMVGIQLENGEVIKSTHGFVAFGGNEVKSELVKQLGVERMENKHIIVDPRTKQTNVSNVWAAGDIAVHSEQVTIAMGDGMQAAIWIHKSILKGKQT